MARKRKTDSPDRLTLRRRLIVEHVIRYYESTNEVIHREIYTDHQPNAVTKAVNRLCSDEWLRKFNLIYPTQYVVPGRRAVQAYGLPPARSLPLGPQSLPTAHGVLLYATSDKNTQRISPLELLSQFDWYAEDWTTAPHCIRHCAGTDVLELVRVDLGGPAHHVARKCHVDVAKRLKSTAFAAAVREQRFRVVIVTPTTEKAASIQCSLAERAWPHGLAFHMAVLPELLPLLPRVSPN